MVHVRRFLASAARITLLLAAVAAWPSPARAQDREQAPPDPEKRAKMLRQGAGLRGGAWWVQNLQEVSGARTSESPAFDGYFQKGLDLHLTLESTLGLWIRTQEIEQSGLGGTTREQVRSFVVPLFTALKLYPFTRPDDAWEPYVTGGVGFALGVDDRQTSGAGLLGIADGGTVLIAGFGFKGGAGVEWRFHRAFGAALGVRYQWVRFGEELGGDRTFRGWGADLGLTYRFQYE
jgi:opacity protein-like surface antigen